MMWKISILQKFYQFTNQPNIIIRFLNSIIKLIFISEPEPADVGKTFAIAVPTIESESESHNDVIINPLVYKQL